MEAMTYAHTATIVTVDGIRPACRVAAGSPRIPGPAAVPKMIDKNGDTVECQARNALSQILKTLTLKTLATLQDH